MKDIIHEQTINGGIAGSKLKVSGTNAFVVLYKRVTLLQLKNWRKQYLEIATKQHLSAEQIASSFVQFINTQLKECFLCWTLLPVGVSSLSMNAQLQKTVIEQTTREHLKNSKN